MNGSRSVSRNLLARLAAPDQTAGGCPRTTSMDGSHQRYEDSWPHLADPGSRRGRCEPSRIGLEVGPSSSSRYRYGSPRPATSPAEAYGYTASSFRRHIRTVAVAAWFLRDRRDDRRLRDHGADKAHFTLAYLVRNTIMNANTLGSAGRVFPQRRGTSRSGRHAARSRPPIPPWQRLALASRRPVRPEPRTPRLTDEMFDVSDTEVMVAPLLVLGTATPRRFRHRSATPGHPSWMRWPVPLEWCCVSAGAIGTGSPSQPSRSHIS